MSTEFTSGSVIYTRPETDFTRDTVFTVATLDENYIENPEKVRWNDNPIPVSGSTPFGIYDADPVFQAEAPRAAKYAARKLGYPNTDIELQDVNFYACLEEAISDYSSQVNQFNIRENIGILQGQPVSTNITQKNIQGIGLNLTIKLSKAYGTEVGTGGNVDWKHGYFETQPGVGLYDLQKILGDGVEHGNRIEIKRVFHHELPASRIFAPYATTGLMGGGEGQPIDLLNELGGGASGGWQFFMTPVFEDLLRWQSVEYNQQMRRSLFSFEIVNNKIRIFPMPQKRFKIWVDYVVEKDRDSQIIWDVNDNTYPNVSDNEDTGSEDTGSCDDVWNYNEPRKSKPDYSGGRVPNPNDAPFLYDNNDQYVNLSNRQIDNIVNLDGGFDPSVAEELVYQSPGIDPYCPEGDADWPGNRSPIPPSPQLKEVIRRNREKNRRNRKQEEDAIYKNTTINSNTPVIGDYSNVPYTFIQYSNINDVGKQWIRKYFLALCKETLGNIRGKYATTPIPQGETTLDGAELRQESAAEKEALILQLRENLEASGRSAQMTKQNEQTKQLLENLKTIPLLIYIA